MTVEEMRELLGLGPDVDPVDVVDAYVTSIEGDAAPEPVVLITLDEAKAHLKVRHSEEDVLIQDKLDDAIAALDGPEGKLQRTLAPTTVKGRFDYLPCGPFRLPFPPVQSVVAIEVWSASGWTVIDSDKWTYEDGWLQAAPGVYWPITHALSGGYRIIYQAGYDVLPRPLRAAILLMLGDLYQNRETTVPTANATKVPMSTMVDDLIAPFIVYR